MSKANPQNWQIEVFQNGCADCEILFFGWVARAGRENYVCRFQLLERDERGFFVIQNERADARDSRNVICEDVCE